MQTPTHNIPLLKLESTNLPFTIHSIQWMRGELGDEKDLPHSHDYYEMVWIIKGSGTFCVDLQQSSFENNHVFCTKPGQVHQLQTDDGVEGFVFSFSETFLNVGVHEFDWQCQSNIFQLFAACRGITIQSDMNTHMKEIVWMMMKEFDKPYSFKAEILRRYLKIFLVYLARQFEETIQASQHTRNDELVEGFMALLEKHFKQKKMVADYAAQLHITPNYLNEIVKKTTGYPAGHHIRQRVVLEAKRMGLYSNSCMKEVAYSLGFSDSAHFSKFFKTVAGTNFSEFKKERQTISVAL